MLFNITFVHSYLPSLSLYSASSSCSRRLNAAGSLERFSFDNARITSGGIPYGFDACGKGFRVVRLLIEATVFCLAEGLPAHAMVRPTSSGAGTMQQDVGSASHPCATKGHHACSP